MLNDFMTRVRVVDGQCAKKKVFLEVILEPKRAELVNFHTVATALRMLFPSSCTVNIDVYGV
jgi:hypothetical protein